MLWRYIYLICILIVLHGRPTLLELHKCDLARNSQFREGNLGQLAVYPWLGVLRVHLHQGNVFKIALTGLVLIKDTFCIANANDIAKIPRSVLKDDSQAMFIPKDNEPWFSKVVDFMTHPEYEFSTFFSIALVELAKNEEEVIPFSPICWPTANFNTANQLFTFGFTDEKKLLEKVVYKMQYVNREPCDEFYNRVGTQNMDRRQSPKHYVCGFALNNKEHCVWDNGMVLASNSSGYWTMIGLGMQGPGCAAPARFLDFTYFQAWIESATSREEIPDYMRRSAFGERFRKKQQDKGEFDDIPAHNLLLREFGTEAPSSQKFFYDKYGEEFFRIDRLDKNAISINFDTTYEKESGDCLALINLIYREEMKIVAKSRRVGLARYKVESLNRSPAYLWYNVTMELSIESRESPREILRPHPILAYKPTTQKPSKWQPHDKLAPLFITETNFTRNVPNMNLYIAFTYSRVAVFTYEVYGPRKNIVAPGNINATETKKQMRFGDENVIYDETIEVKENVIRRNEIEVKTEDYLDNDYSYDTFNGSEYCKRYEYLAVLLAGIAIILVDLLK